MKLYEITKEIQSLEELYLMGIDEETGEIKDIAILEELERGIKTQLEDKGSGIIKFFRNNEVALVSIDDEIKRLQTLKKSIKNKEESFKNYIVKNMEFMNIKKIETELGNLSLRNTPSVEIYDEKLIDKKFITKVIDYKISKTEIKKAIKNGEEVQGARMINKNSLQVK